jgi:hypothetical protein
MSLPFGLAVGCDTEQRKSDTRADLLSPEESLRKLVLVLGPWSTSDKKEAEDFAQRFLKANHASGHYLGESSELVQNLASRFPGESMAMNETDLRNLPAKERELLTRLTSQLYSFIEVRFYVSNEPSWGQCQGDNTWHTRTPMLDKI